MGKEIERRFLVKSEKWRKFSSSSWTIRQGYFNSPVCIRIRIETSLKISATITVKGKPIDDACRVRPEFEYNIPVQDAYDMLGSFCSKGISKQRWHVLAKGNRWEVDVFHGAHNGLVVAEIELSSADQEIEIPKWVGREVTNDIRYSNHSLAIHGTDLIEDVGE